MSESIEQQIAQLEQQLQEKKAALEHNQTSGQEALPSDKEVLHEMVGERIQQQTPTYTPKQPAQNSSAPQSDDPSYLTQELKDLVQELVNLVFTKNLDDGIKEAVKSDNPAVIDAFHDVLVDELYSVLIERKKIPEIK